MTLICWALPKLPSTTSLYLPRPKLGNPNSGFQNPKLMYFLSLHSDITAWHWGHENYILFCEPLLECPSLNGVWSSFESKFSVKNCHNIPIFSSIVKWLFHILLNYVSAFYIIFYCKLELCDCWILYLVELRVNWQQLEWVPTNASITVRIVTQCHSGNWD